MPRLVYFFAPPWRPILLDLAHQERLEVIDGRPRIGIEFGDLYQPLSTQVLKRFLRGDVGELVTEIFGTGEDGTSGRLHQCLLTFEGRHVIELAARLVDARYHANQEHGANFLRVFVLFSAEVCVQPRRKAWLAIPMQFIEIVSHRMEGVIPRMRV